MFGPFWPLHVQNSKIMQLSLFLNFSRVKIIPMVAQYLLKVFQLTELEKLESFMIYDFRKYWKEKIDNSQTIQPFWVKSSGTPFKYLFLLFVKFWNLQSCRGKEVGKVWPVLATPRTKRQNHANSHFSWTFLESKSSQW